MGFLGRLLGKTSSAARAASRPARFEIVGFGVAVAPRGPALIWLRQVGEHQTLCISGVRTDGVLEAQLLPPRLEIVSAGEGLVEVTLQPSPVRAVLHDFQRETDLFDWRPDPESGAWAIRSLGCELTWPARYVIETTPSDAGWPFELKGPCSDDRGAQEALSSCEDAVLVIVRGPIAPGTVTRDQMVTDGQVEVARGGTDEEGWVELHHDSDSEARFQRHELARVDAVTLLVTAQGPRALSAEVRRVAEAVARLNPSS